jgi:hypothetical protein
LGIANSLRLSVLVKHAFLRLRITRVHVRSSSRGRRRTGGRRARG